MQLCRDYWYPIYAFARRRGLMTEDATQGFFLHLMEGGMLKRASAERGKFRTFLLGAMQHFLANERRDQHRQKRGGEEFSSRWMRWMFWLRNGGDIPNRVTAQP